MYLYVMLGRLSFSSPLSFEEIRDEILVFQHTFFGAGPQLFLRQPLRRGDFSERLGCDYPSKRLQGGWNRRLEQGAHNSTNKKRAKKGPNGWLGYLLGMKNYPVCWDYFINHEIFGSRH